MALPVIDEISFPAVGGVTEPDHARLVAPASDDEIVDAIVINVKNQRCRLATDVGGRQIAFVLDRWTQPPDRFSHSSTG